jgi:hypothetical protein
VGFYIKFQHENVATWEGINEIVQDVNFIIEVCEGVGKSLETKVSTSTVS